MDGYDNDMLLLLLDDDLFVIESEEKEDVDPVQSTSHR